MDPAPPTATRSGSVALAATRRSLPGAVGAVEEFLAKAVFGVCITRDVNVKCSNT